MEGASRLGNAGELPLQLAGQGYRIGLSVAMRKVSLLDQAVPSIDSPVTVSGGNLLTR